MRLLPALLIALTLHAETRWSKIYKASVAAVTAASIADADRSLGRVRAS